MSLLSICAYLALSALLTFLYRSFNFRRAIPRIKFLLLMQISLEFCICCSRGSCHRWWCKWTWKYRLHCIRFSLLKWWSTCLCWGGCSLTSGSASWRTGWLTLFVRKSSNKTLMAFWAFFCLIFHLWRKLFPLVCLLSSLMPWLLLLLSLWLQLFGWSLFAWILDRVMAFQ